MARGEAIGETPSKLDATFEQFASRLREMVHARQRNRTIIPIKEI